MCPNTERYFVSLRIQSECGKIRTRNNSVFGHSKYFSVFSPNAEKYEPEITPYSEAFHAVWKYIFNCSKLDYSMYPQRMKISFKYIKQIRRSIEWFTNTVWGISFQIRSLLCFVFFRENFIFGHFSNSISNCPISLTFIPSEILENYRFSVFWWGEGV